MVLHQLDWNCPPEERSTLINFFREIEITFFKKKKKKIENVDL